MKSVSVLALAAAVSATSFNDYSGYNCPSNTDNQCNSQQEGGFTWGDLETGSVSSYGGFDFSGFSCGDGGYGKRQAGSRFAPRTSEKSISGSCGHSTDSSPSFGCSSSGDVSAFSVTEISVYTEFDCDLEFHYDMPDGSTCKHRSACSSQGSTISNTQCGGAKNVTIVYPTGQTGDSIPKASSTCSVSIPTISFDCGSASSTVTRATQTPSSAAKTTLSKATPTPESKTSSTSDETSSYTISEYKPTGPAKSQTSKGPSTTYILSTAPVSPPAESIPVEYTTSNSPVQSTSPAESVPATSAEESTTYVITSSFVTSFQTTSTVYSTAVQTITSCAPEVTDCPAREGETATTTVVVALSTTICPVTETQTSTFVTSHAITKSVTLPAESAPAVPATPATPIPEEGTTSVSPVGSSEASSLAVPTTTTVASPVSPAAPTDTLPCPTILPQCIATWNYIVGCVDNSDSSCYCPSSDFVQKVYDCLYAYGDSDETVSDAVQYFQGICGSYAGGNPAVVTGAPYTTYLTATASAPAQVTTIVIESTTVVPCTNDAGSAIPSSSSTVVVSAYLTVPQVGLTTYVASTGTEVGVVPVSSYVASAAYSAPAYSVSAAPVASGVSSAGPIGGSAASSAAVASGVASGTAAYTAPTSPSATSIVTAGAGKVGAGFGAAIVVMAAVAAL